MYCEIGTINRPASILWLYLFFEEMSTKVNLKGPRLVQNASGAPGTFNKNFPKLLFWSAAHIIFQPA